MVRVTIAILTIAAAGLLAQQAFAYGTDCTIEDIRWGERFFGEPRDLETIRGHVVVVMRWTVSSCPLVAPRVARMHQLYTTYEPQGMILLGTYDGCPVAGQQFLTSRRMNFTNMSRGAVTVRGCKQTLIYPHIYLFDHTGACVFRGSPNDVDDILRTTMRAAPAPALTKVSLDRMRFISEGLKAGRPPHWAFTEAAKHVDSEQEQVASEAKQVLEALNDWGVRRIESALSIKDNDPAGCLEAVTKLTVDFRGTEIEKKAREAIDALRANETFMNELRAFQMLDRIKEIERQIRPLRGPAGNDTLSDEFRRRNAATLNNLRGGIQRMRASFPGTKATAEATEIGRKYGIVFIN